MNNYKTAFPQTAVFFLLILFLPLAVACPECWSYWKQLRQRKLGHVASGRTTSKQGKEKEQELTSIINNAGGILLLAEQSMSTLMNCIVLMPSGLGNRHQCKTWTFANSGTRMCLTNYLQPIWAC
jgi:hypothetical protein